MGFGVEFGEFTDVAPVVVTKQEGHIIGYTHPFVVIILHFFVQGPHLWGFLDGFTRRFGNDFALITHYAFEQFDGRTLRHGFVAVTTHA